MAKIETTFIRPKELYTPETGETKVVYDGYQNNPHELITEDGFAGALDTAMPTALAKAQVIETTWQELKDKRDNGQLIAGSLYRITDYKCTTNQENTRSAGHQFDIVLLALSENKLAEEGWAMEHPTDIYDVTFAQDNVTKKCYLYKFAEDDVNLVFVDNLLGLNLGMTTEDFLAFDAINKTATLNMRYSEFMDYVVEGVQYNYFQNSNLSAWKVWYCLDNDKSRFAWADDGEIESIDIYGDVYSRNSQGDADGYYAWRRESTIDYKFTKSPTPKVGDITYISDGNGHYEDDDLITGVSGFGRGVIYRLIDEWNNDVAYDFKNILYLRKMTAGVIDVQGTDTYIPTFCLYDRSNDEYRDASVFAIEYPDDEGYARPCQNIFIGSIIAINHSIDSGIYALPQNIILKLVDKGDTGWSSRDATLVDVFMCNFQDNISSVICLSSSNKTYGAHDNAIISRGKRVVWENIS